MMKDKELEFLPPGEHRIDAGLYLVVSDTGSRRWEHRYMFNGNRRYPSLGTWPAVSLKLALDMRDKNKRMIIRKIDPVVHEKAKNEKNELLTHTFKEAADEYFKTHRVSKTTAQQRRSWFARFVYTKIETKLVNDIDSDHVKAVLGPIFDCNSRTVFEEVRRLCEGIIESAVYDKWRERGKDNPFAAAEVYKKYKSFKDGYVVEHHAALRWQQIPEFMVDLRQRVAAATDEYLSPRVMRGPPKLTWLAGDCLEFLILTGVRRSNALAARWCDIDMNERVWHIRGCDSSSNDRVGTRMKMKHEHWIPLSAPAIEVLKRHVGRHDQWVFPGWRGTPINHKLVWQLLQEMGYTDPTSLDQYGKPNPITAHGFRSTFTDWVADCTAYSDVLAEMALAHETRSASYAPYKRTKLLDQRRMMMDEWAAFCGKPPADVIPLRRKGRADA